MQRAQESTQPDTEIEFFVQGERGAYDGGSGSLAPLALDETLELDDALPNPEIAARRERYTRWVRRGVGGLAVAFGLVVSVAGTRGAPTPAEESARLASVAVANPVADGPADDAVVLNRADSIETAVVAAEEEAPPAEPAAGAADVPVPEVAAPPPKRRAAPPRRAHSPVRAKVSRPRSAPAARVAPTTPTAGPPQVARFADL